MIIIKYESEDEGRKIIAEKESAGYTLVEVQNITEGNFLGFQEPGWVPPEEIPDQVKKLQDENNLLKAQNLALSDRADFIEDCIAEMAQQVYQ